MHPDALVADFAASRDGVATRAQLLRIGLAPKWIDRRVISGHLHAVHRGVYAVGQPVMTERGRRRAALLAAGPGARLTHRACGAEIGVMDAGVGPVDITREARSRPRAGLRLHCARLPHEDCDWHLGLPVTGVPRLLLDLAENEPRVVERVYNEAQVQRLVSRQQLLDALTRWRGRPGVALLRDLADDDLGVRRSTLEDDFVPVLRQAKLALPKLNVWVEGLLVDAYWARHRIVVELDGRRVHGTDHRYESDRARDTHLIAHGYLPLRFTYRRLKREPLAVIAELAAALALNDPELRR